MRLKVDSKFCTFLISSEIEVKSKLLFQIQASIAEFFKPPSELRRKAMDLLKRADEVIGDTAKCFLISFDATVLW